jgi:hypothetical protein
MEGLLANAADFYESMADDDLAFGAFVTAWAVKFPDSTVGVAELLPIALETLDLGGGTGSTWRARSPVATVAIVIAVRTGACGPAAMFGK